MMIGLIALCIVACVLWGAAPKKVERIARSCNQHKPYSDCRGTLVHVSGDGERQKYRCTKCGSGKTVTDALLAGSCGMEWADEKKERERTERARASGE